jgi:SAM-dependent methyltransferase
MVTTTQEPNQVHLISHNFESGALNTTVEKIKQIIDLTGDKPGATVAKQIEIVEELSRFPLGSFILQNRGTDGFWTDYMIQHPSQGRLTGVDPQGRPLTEFEKVFLNQFPMVVATQERAVIFGNIIQLYVQEGAVLASLPCGLMRDLLGLNFGGIQNIRLVGLDLDIKSLQAAEKLAADYGLSESVEFHQVNAWQQPFVEEFNLLTSNGLNVYEPDDRKVIDLYRQFYRALKPGGVLVTSCITPPPIVDENSEWDLSQINQEGLLLQQIVFAYILGFNFQGLRSSATTRTQLELAGFQEIQVIGDRARVFPTLVARKPA